MKTTSKNNSWREKLHEVIYEADTPAGKAFDVVLLVIIFLSILFVMLESVKGLDAWIYDYMYAAEWVITILFTIEYILRIISIKKPTKYIFSFYGLIDFFSTIPLYVSFFLPGSGSALITVRALRLLRVFRILKVSRYIGESNKLIQALKDSRAKILVFLFAVLILCLVFGTAMYMIEGAESGFTNIPVSLYWCIVTLTTVGFGDIHPITPLGQFLASVIMILGYGVIAVPTGIVSAEYSKGEKNTSKSLSTNTQSCYHCHESKHVDGADYCHNCGYSLNREK
ncbi:MULTISPECIES: ion transporter [Mesonia]|uniref:PH-gated potassium channel KcsA n=1 Tax=Mesonia oceanica TaxID=2687242 RepID=A0AC61YC04_9FLAO|nr:MULTISPECIES: ion transporter [Mesonia]MAN29126.1 ion transporter [Mesonia sp.]MBJ98359.1 ion transporter [Flavobacteriaceae bacterium]VVV01795.1 pH-gated potassium channel KcsA [Mesonia oceanica]